MKKFFKFYEIALIGITTLFLIFCVIASLLGYSTAHYTIPQSSLYSTEGAFNLIVNSYGYNAYIAIFDGMVKNPAYYIMIICWGVYFTKKIWQFARK